MYSHQVQTKLPHPTTASFSLCQFFSLTLQSFQVNFAIICIKLINIFTLFLQCKVFWEAIHTGPIENEYQTLRFCRSTLLHCRKCTLTPVHIQHIGNECSRGDTACYVSQPISLSATTSKREPLISGHKTRPTHKCSWVAFPITVPRPQWNF